MALERTYSDEWGFELDLDGTSLNQAFNSGTNSPLAQFDAGFDGTVFTTNRALLCTGEDAGSAGIWTNGAIMDAAFTPVSSGINYLRYDVDYDFSSPDNDSGNIMGVYFTDASGDQAAGLILGYDTGNLQSTKPASWALIDLTNNIPLVGTLIAIAEVDMDQNTLRVWYDLSGANVFDENSPAATQSINSMASVDHLTFHATGDFRPAGSSDNAAVDNIRRAETWSEIVEPPPNEGAPPNLEISVTVPPGMDIGESNVVTVVISNSGGPANAVTSSLVHDGAPADFTIVSNNIPAALETGALLTNTYWLTANTDGRYIFTTQAFSAETNSASTQFNLAVGSSISYVSNSIVEVPGTGSFPGQYEPGETLDITVFSINDGSKIISNITNTLSSDMSFFTAPVPASGFYASLAIGATTSTTYRVTINADTPAGSYLFEVANDAGANAWIGSFPLPVYAEAFPGLSPTSLLLRVAPEGTDTETVIVTNAGNAPLSFTVTDDCSLVTYTDVTGSASVEGFANHSPIPLNNEFNPETHGVSDAVNLGFNFPLYGASYTQFYVTADGMIGLINPPNTPPVWSDDGPGEDDQMLPDGTLPLIAPFWSDLVSPAGAITYRTYSDRVVITWSGVDRRAFGGGTNLTFQAILYKTGEVEFRYDGINGDNLEKVTVGVQSGASEAYESQVTPASGVSVRLLQVADCWVTYSPTRATVPPFGSVRVDVTAQGAGRQEGAAVVFNAQFAWSSGGSLTVLVDAAVVPPVPEYSALNAIDFSGPAGVQTPSPFWITNSGTADLIFSISDHGVAQAGYIVTTNPPFVWEDISNTLPLVFNDTEMVHVLPDDEGFTDLLPIGFNFPFAGMTFTHLSVSANGTLRFDSAERVFALWSLASTHSSMPDQMLAPFWGDLRADNGASVYVQSTASQMVVSWENLREYGQNGGSNLTFQVLLKPDGEILFQYLHLDGTLWATRNVIGLRDTPNRITRASIIQPDDWTVVTNEPSGLVTTQYVDWVENRSLRFDPAEIQLITFAPEGGTVPPDGRIEITLTGDATGLSTGTGSVINQTMLMVTHNGTPPTDTLDVTFTVTNALPPMPMMAALDGDGDGMTDDDERIAGTDPQNDLSFFAPSAEPTAEGMLLSWDGTPDRTYKVYWTDHLMGGWILQRTVTGGTEYLDTEHLGEPVSYYKVTAE